MTPKTTELARRQAAPTAMIAWGLWDISSSGEFPSAAVACFIRSGLVAKKQHLAESTIPFGQPIPGFIQRALHIPTLKMYFRAYRYRACTPPSPSPFRCFLTDPPMPSLGGVH